MKYGNISKCKIICLVIKYMRICVCVCFQKPDTGLIFPDRATLYVTAIEDRQYKDEKINCKPPFFLVFSFYTVE